MRAIINNLQFHMQIWIRDLLKLSTRHIEIYNTRILELIGEFQRFA